MVKAARHRRRARRGEGDRLREEIFEATERLLARTNDFDAVSVRDVATAVGVTSPSIYLHFESKEQLLLEVCERHFQTLDAVMVAATTGIDDPYEAIQAMGTAYIRFGLSHPEQYRFLFMTRTPEWATEHIQESLSKVSGFSRVVDAAQRCIDAGIFVRGDAFTIACGLWMGVHGMTSLLISKPTFPWPNQDALIEHGVEAYCRGLRA